MSARITRSSARQAANSEAGSPTTAQPDQPTDPPPPIEPPKGSARKRKSRAVSSNNPASEQSPSSRQSKRQKTAKPKAAPSPPSLLAPPAASTRSQKGKAPAMSSPSPAAGPVNPSGGQSSSSNSRKASRSKKSSKNVPGEDITMSGTDDAEKELGANNPEVDEPERGDENENDNHDEDNDEENDDENEDRHRDYDDEEMPDISDPFGGQFGGPGSRLGGLLGSMLSMAGISSRLREILTNLKQKGDASLQLVALQELSELLLVSNEDNLSGTFHPDAYVKELVALMQPNEFTGEENPEIMLLACRCLANLMEALPASVSSIIYNGAVPVLCQKLLEISFIDLAEQALSTLEKISVEYPASIVREGGLTACLSYLEFFATSTQRTAVTTAANCCRNIPQDSFPVVRDVMPILLNVLGSSDQRVVEQASLCVSRIIESFQLYPSKLEELVNVNMLQAILRLLLPGSTNLISPNIHTQFLRVLGIIAQKSPRLSAELFKLNVVETLYQILTGVSPPSGTEDVASKLDSVLIMQSLIHRPREQIVETLNVICGLLPTDCPQLVVPSAETEAKETTAASTAAPKKKSSNEKRVELLGECKEEVRRFALILFPTLTDAFSSTVNYDVRNRVLTAHIQMLSNLDRDVLVDALRAVPYASFLASILSQRDHPLLVKYALDAAELLMSRLDDIYRYQLYREGVIAEIEKLSVEAPAIEPKNESSTEPGASGGPPAPAPDDDDDSDDSDGDDDDEGNDDDGEDDDDDEDDEDHDEDRSHHSSDEDGEERPGENDLDHDGDGSVSPVSSTGSSLSMDWLTKRLQAPPPAIGTLAALAKKFLEIHETEKHGKSMKKKATKILTNLSSLATEIEDFYLRRTSSDLSPQHGTQLFKRLASFFDTDVLESVTSAETLTSGLVRVLEAVFSNPDEALAEDARSAFLQVFMGYAVKSGYKTATADSPATPFSVMIHKLQDLLSRSEHFEVLTVHHNAYDGNRSSAASMLAKQIRLKLMADEESAIPKSYRNIMVSIHAIATFKTLDDYLRPRIIMSERPSRGDRKMVARDIAALAGAVGLPLSAAAQRLAERAATPHLDGQIPSRPPPPGQPPARVSRRSKSKSQPQPDAPATPSQASNAREKAVPRRSSRRHAASAETPPPPPPPEEADPLANALECADERRMDESDDDDDDDDLGMGMGHAALDAIVGDLDEDMDDEPVADPSAVNLEVAAGGKVTARKEDGTRVHTPSQGGSAPMTAEARRSALVAALQGTPTPSSSSRPMSYAAAISLPQNWHIEFSIDGKVISNESTIYRAIQNLALNADENMGRNIWSAVHTIKFKRVNGPAPTESIAFGSGSGSDASQGASDAVGSLAKNPTAASILRLLKLLHDFNANLDDILVENKDTLRLNVEPLSQFVNTKLTAKLNRQLEEPLIVASNCMPSWSEDLARLYPFLFPFETRHLFLQSTSYGYARSMTRWQNAQSQEDNNRRDRRDDRPFLGRLQRQKVRISRSRILESAIKVMELYGAAQSILEVEYFEEVGTGLGPTLEFYSTVSKEFAKKRLKLWRDSEGGDGEDFVSSPTGLFPRPLSEEDSSGANGERIMTLFKTLGKFVARSMLDSRIIDVDLNPIFFRIGEEASGIRPSLGAVKLVDPALARSLMLIKKFATAKKDIEENPRLTPAQKVAQTQAITVNNIRIEDLSLDFTLPGHPEIELIADGSQVNLTIENVDSYLEKVIDMTLGAGVRRQVDAFREGFSKVFPYIALSAFTPTELAGLFGRTDEDWSLETLVDSVKADHGFTIDSRSVKNLLQTMSELDMQQRRDFLQFTTGSPKLPIGGFRSLTPMFTVVCKPSEAPYTSDDYLPSVMTCVNYLKLPDYSSIDVMRKQLFTATKEGQGAFHLS